MVLLAAPKPVSNPYAAAAIRVEQLGPDLAAAILRRKLTLTAAAQQIGISRTTLIALMSGSNNSTRSTIVAALHWLATQRDETL